MKFAELLNDDESGWLNAARWINKRALEEGFDLAAKFDSAEIFARSVMEGMRFHVDLDQRFPGGVAELENFEIAEELFWRLTPHGN